LLARPRIGRPWTTEHPSGLSPRAGRNPTSSRASMRVTSNAEGGSVRGMEIRELECLILVAEEMHCGREAMRLGLPVEQARELVERLEHSIGTPLLDASGERLRLSSFGNEFLASLRPAYGALVSVLEDARDRASGGRRMVRLGFPEQMRDPVD